MTPVNAFISVDELCYSWLLRQNKTIHFYYKALALAAEAVRELSLTTLPIINHKLLYKEKEETWFPLPKDYTEWVSVSVRTGEYYRPIAVSNRLMPMPNQMADAPFDSSFDDAMQEGTWTNWLNPAGVAVYNSFSPTYFNGGNFLTAPATLTPTLSSDSTTDYRGDVAVINRERGIIVVPHNFPGNELYIVYVGIGGVDTMTHIPVMAQAAIEAYINWKYAMNKRGGLTEGRILKQDYDEQHRILRGRLNDLTTVDIRRVMNDNYGRVKIE